MKTKLFETGEPDSVPKMVLVKCLLKARKVIGKGEDDWDTSDTVIAINLLSEEYKEHFKGVDVVRFKNMMQRLRKDKLVPKVKKPSEMMQRLEKMARDFRRNQKRDGYKHSKEYLDYITSDLWRCKAKEHKERCNWKCQLCGADSSKLECHHTSEGYRYLGKEMPWHLLAVCSNPCHPIVDMMRKYGFVENQALAFFSEDAIPS